MGNDVRFGARLLTKSPVFTVTAALLLAIGIGANTLIFSVMDSVLLRRLPVSHPEKLVRIVEVHTNQFVTWTLPYDFCNGAAARDADFSSVVCQGEADVAFRDGAATERVRVHLVSPNFFTSLGITAYLGRVLNAEDERSRAPFAVLSHRFWKSRLHGDPAAIGHTITLGKHPFRIVGVMPEDVNGLTADTSPDVRVPASTDKMLVTPSGEMNPQARALFGEAFARLRDGVQLGRANAAVDALLSESYQEESEKVYPSAQGTARTKTVPDSRLQLESIANGVFVLRPQFSRSLRILMAAVALLLLMACANVAGLLLARSAGRAGEIGVRLALGAGPGRIVRQLLTEGLLLASLGGAGGLLLTILFLPSLTSALPPIRDRGAVLQPLTLHITIDPWVLAFIGGITLLTAILFALSPAIQCARADVAAVLGASRVTVRRQSMRNAMVAAQIAICTLLLMGAALLVATLQRMRGMDPGFDRDHVVTLTVDPGMNGYTPEQSREFSKTLLEKARSMPAVAAASLASRGLMRGTGVKATFGAAGTIIGLPIS